MSRIFESVLLAGKSAQRRKAVLASILAALYIFAAGCSAVPTINSDLPDASQINDEATVREDDGSEESAENNKTDDTENSGNQEDSEASSESEEVKPDPDTSDLPETDDERNPDEGTETEEDQGEQQQPDSNENSTDSGEDPSDAGNEVEAESSFSIHFIDVGQADAALVECDGHYMLIDGGNRDDSNLIYSVLSRNAISVLDIVVGTHAHEDHIGGLSGAFNYAVARLTLCPVTDYDSDTFRNFKRYADEKGGGITVPAVGDTFALGSATITILGVNGGKDTNDTSIVLKIRYGETTFLFTGDAEREAEQAILNSGADLSSTVLKVGHHGSDTSTSYLFLRGILPKYAVISVGSGNSYGHPTEETLSRLRDADVTVYRTDMQGDIFCVSDGKYVTFTVTRNSDANTLSPSGESNGGSDETPDSNGDDEDGENDSQGVENVHDYIGNLKTKKFHYPGCRHVGNMKEENKLYYTGTRDELIEMGYSPCGTCDP